MLDDGWGFIENGFRDIEVFHHCMEMVIRVINGFRDQQHQAIGIWARAASQYEGFETYCVIT